MLPVFQTVTRTQLLPSIPEGKRKKTVVLTILPAVASPASGSPLLLVILINPLCKARAAKPFLSPDAPSIPLLLLLLLLLLPHPPPPPLGKR